MMTMEMSKNCKYFVQHAWKRDLCANCFESREDHWKKLKQLNIFTSEFVADVKSILRQCENSQKQRKNVVFRASLTEIIGYDGGDDDIYDYCDHNSNGPDENDVKNRDTNDDNDAVHDDDGDKRTKTTNVTRLLKTNVPDDDDDRALSNITRSNTNFNRITANLNDFSVSPSSSSDINKVVPKCFNNLMLGNIQKDSEGKKKTLLVSVTPFGANTNVNLISIGRSVDDAPTGDENKRRKPMKTSELSNIRSDLIPTSVLNYQLPKENETCEKKCGELSEPMLEMRFSHDEVTNDDATPDVLTNDGVDIENELIRTPLLQNVTSDVNHVEINSAKSYQIRSVNTAKHSECPESVNLKNDTIHVLKFSVEKILENTSSNSSSMDRSNINTLNRSSINPPKPRNSFLHGGKNIDDSDNTSIKPDQIYGVVDSSFYSILSKNNSQNMGIPEQITPKSPEKLSDDFPSSIFTRKPATSLKSDCPVVREKEKRERATSCSPKVRNLNEKSFNRNYDEMPESMSKRYATRSLSRHDSSSYSQVLSNTNSFDEEAKKKNRTRFSLKRLLRIGSSKKDLNITTGDSFVESTSNTTPISQFKIKPEIIHPLELDGAAVEILYHDKLIKSMDEIMNTKSSNVKVAMREPPPPPPINVHSSSGSDCHQLSMSKSAGPLYDGHERKKLSTPDTDRERPSCHSITSTATSTTHSLTTDSIHSSIHNFGKFRPIQCN